MENEHLINLYLDEKNFKKLVNGGCVAGSIRLRDGSEQIADLRVYIRTHGEAKTQTVKTAHGKVTVGPIKRSFTFKVDAALPVEEAAQMLRDECDEAIRFIELKTEDE
ncbi:MAG: hypothetical protein ACOYJG_00215 [Prevotella sp.]|jgi:hypothetical protein